MLRVNIGPFCTWVFRFFFQILCFSGTKSQILFETFLVSVALRKILNENQFLGVGAKNSAGYAVIAWETTADNFQRIPVCYKNSFYIHLFGFNSLGYTEAFPASLLEIEGIKGGNDDQLGNFEESLISLPFLTSCF